eukprot:TRINITY_DN1315_c0_g2_i1.p1 TRINITY_DN1315_c0_g2~~TRINITY_DN1315_c0_g2_i1.p1  ORF type:complete len:237 (+),score=38.91 TRINITY_DN1315_c0_g2_i1:1-711(+)
MQETFIIIFSFVCYLANADRFSISQSNEGIPISWLPGNVPNDWLSSEEGCDREYFNANDGCDCKCGYPDPDCSRPGKLYNCDESEICDAGKCKKRYIPPSWHCPPEYFEDRYWCDCECGYPDPDCKQLYDGTSSASYALYNCESYQWCDPSGHCNYYPKIVPQEWICAQDRWNDKQYCDCNCGSLDPDCINDLPLRPDSCQCDGMTCKLGFCAGVCPELGVRVIVHRKATWLRLGD